jgi:serine/threonine protein kinase
MALKREISASLANLHHSVKRLHIDDDPDATPPSLDTVQETDDSTSSAGMFNQTTGHPTIDPMATHHPLTTVVSRAGADFGAKYEMKQELGRGGFSVVYECKSIATGQSYAVKIIDLRPLRLRDSFDAMRLRREVDIMRQLRHPSIVQFEEVFESPDQLFVVMEHAPGYELFDAILSRGHFSEADAMPIFAQIARALLYLHSLNIIHRDIKPENILVLRDPDQSGQPIAKLLDFGLSKHTGLGSEAKTFVGTPCYLAPEVEFASKGTGATYGAPADCWSLGAVLYVMLVARFPVFEVDNSTRPPTTRLSLPSELFRNTSPDAKDLLRSLMCFNVTNRLSMKQALTHPWLSPQYRLTQEEMSRLESSSSSRSGSIGSFGSFASSLGGLPAPPHMPPLRLHEPANPKTPPPEDALGTSMELVRRVVDAGGGGKSPSAGLKQLTLGVDQLGLTPLLHFQSNIAACFDDALTAYQYMPEIATEIRRGADLCRRQLMESTKMLRKIEQTACSVLEMFPDLELAISEEEPNLANKFFGMMKGWVSELMLLVDTTQAANRASMEQIQKIVERSTRKMHVNMLQKDVKASLNSLAISNKGGSGGAALAGASMNADFLIKMKRLIGVVLNKDDSGPESGDDAPAAAPAAAMMDEEAAPTGGDSDDVENGKESGESMEHQLLQMFDIMLGRVLNGQDVDGNGKEEERNDRAIEYNKRQETPDTDTVSPEMDVEPTSPSRAAANSISSVYVEDDNVDDSFEKESGDDIHSASGFSSDEESVHSDARKELQHALGMLRQVRNCVFMIFTFNCANSYLIIYLFVVIG